MPDIIREAVAVGELTGSRQEITIATPGWGSSGYYSPALLETAAAELVFPKGTQMHMDHDGEMARFEQPAGSTTRLAAALDENARWQPDWIDPESGVKGRLVAEANVFTPWRAFLAEVKDVIGASLSASATASKGEAEGRKGTIIEKLHPSPLNRVDYVTKAGRGGRISAVLESAIHRQAEEATANETRQLLNAALKAANPGDDVWSWIRDYDASKVWYELETEDAFNIYEQGWALEAGAISLAADRVEVRSITSYVPVTATTTEALRTVVAPQDSSPVPAEVTTEAKSKETNMAEINIEESRLATLEESHGRVPALEAKVEAAEKRANESDRRRAVAESTVRARDFAATLVKAANADLSEAVVARIVQAATAEIPLTEALQLDTDALTEATNAARTAEETYLAQLAKENGLGQVKGIGATEATTAPAKTRAEILEALNGAVK